VALQATEFSYGPARIEALVGQQVTVRMRNLGTLEHDFVIQEIPLQIGAEDPGEMPGHNMGTTEIEAAVHAEAMPGMEGVVSFTPTMAGTYQFFCAVPGHKDAGMIGALSVLER
jgi:uncharacterized cupredoxin-like copper-binding protein